MKKLQRAETQVLIHSLYSVTLGLLGGIGLIYSALNEVAIWPLGSWEWKLPGEVGLWRAVHVGPLLNAVLAIALLYMARLLILPQSKLRRISLSLVLMLWGNGLFYLLRIWGNSRGLAVDSAQFGPGNIADVLAMIAASVAMLTTFYATFVLLKEGLKNLRGQYE